MTYPEAIAILKAHNEWRRDNEGKHAMLDPKLIGEAIDLVVNVSATDSNLKLIFDNNFNCYADTWSQDGIGAPMVQGDVVPAMTCDKFIEVVKSIFNQ